jgi:hypothetical protein
VRPDWVSVDEAVLLVNVVPATLSVVVRAEVLALFWLAGVAVKVKLVPLALATPEPSLDVVPERLKLVVDASDALQAMLEVTVTVTPLVLLQAHVAGVDTVNTAVGEV